MRSIEILEPDRPAVQLQHRVVADRARAETARERQVQPVPDHAPLPLLGPKAVVEDESPLLLPAAAAVAVRARADEQVALDLDDPKSLASGLELDGRDARAGRGRLARHSPTGPPRPGTPRLRPPA